MGNLISNTSTKGKIGIGVAAVAVVLVAIMLMRIASSPSYSTVASGIDPSQTSKMTAALDQKGIKWQLQNNGTAIAVDSGQTAQARVALASSGVPSNGTEGWSLFQKQKLGASNLQQQVTYQQALEGELTQTIDQVQGVQSSQVNLVLPEQQLFADQASQARASVLLNTGGVALDAGSVRGIAQLVMGGVKGLSLNNISITDNTGQLLWPTGDSLANGPTANLKQAAESRFNMDLGARLQALLNQTVGVGKGTVQVNADMNVDQTTKDALLYASKGVPLTKKTQTENLKGSGTGASGTAGTGSNIPTYSAGGSGGNNNYKNTTEDTTYGVSKTVSHTKVAPGTINKLGVAVLVDKSVAPAEVAQLQSAVLAAAGIDKTRGDTLTVTQVPFAKASAAKPAGPAMNPIAYAKYVFLGLGVMLFLFFMSRHLKKREEDTLLREPTWLRQIESPTSLKELEAAAAIDIPSPEQSATKRGLEELAARSPDRVAQQVRMWMGED